VGIGDTDKLSLDTVNNKIPMPQLLYENDKFALLLIFGVFNSSLLFTLSKKDGKFINEQQGIVWETTITIK
jgi:hypothetical protein